VVILSILRPNGIFYCHLIHFLGETMQLEKGGRKFAIGLDWPWPCFPKHKDHETSATDFLPNERKTSRLRCALRIGGNELGTRHFIFIKTILKRCFIYYLALYQVCFANAPLGSVLAATLPLKTFFYNIYHFQIQCVACILYNLVHPIFGWIFILKWTRKMHPCTHSGL
jgi:hypothetical protein